MIGPDCMTSGEDGGSSVPPGTGRRATVPRRPQAAIMTLRPYSVNPPRLALQVVADVLVLAWIYLWYRLGVAVHDAVTSAASVGYRIQNSAGGVAGSLDEAGRNVGNAPIVGGTLSGPLRTAAEQIGGLAGSGRDLGDRLMNAATPVGW